MSLHNDIFDASTQLNQDFFESAELLAVDTDDESLRRIDATAPYDTKGGMMVASYRRDGHREFLVAEPSHTLLVGSTGSGKTQGFYMPAIEFLANSVDKPSMLIMDVKHEIYREKAELLRKQGYRILALDGSSPFTSAKFNPLGLIWRSFHRANAAKKLLAEPKTPYAFNGKNYGNDIRSWRIDVNAFINKEIDFYNGLIASISETLVPVMSKDPFWDYGSREIARLTILAMLEDSLVPARGMTEEKFTLYNVLNVINSRQDDCDVLESYVKLHARTAPSRRLENYVSSKAKITRDSFLMCTINYLARSVNHSCNCLTCANDIDIEEVAANLDKPTAIFLMIDSTNEATHMVCNMFLKQLMSELQHRGDEKALYDFHVLWDEFATSGMKTEAISNWITTMRSRRVWFHLGVQSYQQLDHLYGQSVRVNISGNAKLIFCGSNDAATIKEVAGSFGQKIGSVSSYSVANTGDVQMSVQPNNSPLVRMSDLAQLHLGEAYVRIFGTYGNKQLRTVLEPNFRCEDYAHGNAVLEPASAYLELDIVSTFYDIEQVVKASDDDDDDSSTPKRRKSPWDFI